MFLSTGMKVNSENFWQDLGPILSKKFSFRFEVGDSTDVYLGLSTRNSTTFSGYWIVLEIQRAVYGMDSSLELLLSLIILHSS